MRRGISEAGVGAEAFERAISTLEIEIHQYFAQVEDDGSMHGRCQDRRAGPQYFLRPGSGARIRYHPPIAEISAPAISRRAVESAPPPK